jgi:hypothetical protein
MGCVATTVLRPRLVSLSKDNSDTLNRMPKVWKEGVSMYNILEVPNEIDRYCSVLYYCWLTTLTMI